MSYLFAAIAYFLTSGLTIILLRRHFVQFADDIIKQLDELLAGRLEADALKYQDTLSDKVHHRMVKLHKIITSSQARMTEERTQLQELVSDISHQVKTPIANLKMINSTLLDNEMPCEQQREFLKTADGQLDKLDFLMQSMIKTSRLETGVIALKKTIQPLYDTLASALGGILFSAENKRIRVTVDCPESLAVSHDRKWTGEALFNILDNAVKYSEEGGCITVKVLDQEMYVKIEISDTGKGIAECHQADIWKRFYREEDVHDVDGIGIGLYVARKIITLQSGYIVVSSQPGEGAAFSVYLPKKF
ncbi:sensor histidine kinase [Emergencia timonensis]|uniref:sensor histidine kinase n=1 Tax=Emergencia timonensis TaxID=1776384 RepID=UPI0039F4D068